MSGRIRGMAWRHKWFEWFHVIYASVVIITAFSSIFPTNPNVRELLLLGAFTSYTVILLFFLIVFTFKFSRKARYSEATKCIHSALHNARNAFHYLDWCKSTDYDHIVFDKEKLCQHMTTTLTSVSAAFTLVTGVKCRASIKVIGQTADNQLYVTTLARDEVSKTESEQRDRAEGKGHLVSANTDFHLITNGNLNYFFNGNLPKHPDYINTSDGKNGSYWNLPYKSTIVWPIRYVFTKYEIESLPGDTTEDLLGFLTIDSSSVNAFIEKYDVEMGAALADALYPVLNAYVGFKATN